MGCGVKMKGWQMSVIMNLHIRASDRLYFEVVYLCLEIHFSYTQLSIDERSEYAA